MSKEQKLRVLVAMETSGKVRRAFEARGHSVISCDLLPADDNAANHIQGDVFDILEHGHYDLMIAHPSCQYLCVSGLHWNKRRPERALLTEDALADVRKLMAAKIPMIAIENPIGCISTRIRKPDQIIQPYQFGHDASKKTCLWLKNLTKLTTTKFIPGKWSCGKHRWDQSLGPVCTMCEGEGIRLVWGNQTPSGQNRLGPSEDRWKLRSETYDGIADAMADRWG
jgi:hypothetical protein